MQATLLSPDERTVIDALAAEGERTLPADLDPAVHSLEQRGWISLMSRGAVIDGEREYMLDLTPHGRVVAGRSRPRESRPARGARRIGIPAAVSEQSTPNHRRRARMPPGLRCESCCVSRSRPSDRP
jgi:hypothetical protein